MVTLMVLVDVPPLPSLTPIVNESIPVNPFVGVYFQPVGLLP